MTWDPSELVLKGRFASAPDREELVQALAGEVGLPAGIVVFSNRYVLPSLSRVISDDNYHRQIQIVDQIVELSKAVLPATDAAVAIEGVIQQLLPCEVTAVVRPERFGDLGVLVVWPEDGQERPQAVAKARALATAVLGSFIATSHRDNAFDRELLRRMSGPVRVPKTGPLTSVEAVPLLVGHQRMREVVELCAETCSAVGAGVYEQREGSLKLVVSTGQIDALSDAIAEAEVAALPPPEVETGISKFKSAGDCVALSSLRNQRLLGRCGEVTVFASPFGSVPADPKRVAGVFVMILGRAGALDSHQLALVRNVCGRLARSVADRRWFDSIARLSRRVSEITNGEADGGMPVGMASTVHRRRDLRMLGSVVSDVLQDLVTATGSASATFRVVVGSGQGWGERALARITCVGDGCELRSPAEIPIEQGPTSSVNGWVARHGRPCYLRSIAEGEDGLPVVDGLDDYPELEGVVLFRDGIRSELCVPVIAESRLVGTINLESRVPFGFDESAAAAKEYAHTIGLAVVMARRELGVEMLDAAGGFLDRRHEIEAKVGRVRRELGSQSPGLLSPTRSASMIGDLLAAEHLLLGPDLDNDEPNHRSDLTIQSAVSVAMARYHRQVGVRVPLDQLIVGQVGSSEVESLLEITCERSVFHALTFALGQALVNAHRHGLKDGDFGYRRPAEWRSDMAVRLLRSQLGGDPMVLVLVQSCCTVDDLEGLKVDCVFREPLQSTGDRHRVQLGAYLAGEAMRRAGGAAYFGVGQAGDDEVRTVSQEFSFPV